MDCVKLKGNGYWLKTNNVANSSEIGQIPRCAEHVMFAA